MPSSQPQYKRLARDTRRSLFSTCKYRVVAARGEGGVGVLSQEARQRKAMVEVE